MNTFLGELARRLAEKWVVLLMLPGALHIGTALLSWRLGRGSWGRGQGFADDLGNGTATSGQVLVAAVAVLLLAAAAGLTARAGGRAVQWLWLGQWPHRLGRRLVRRRRRRWEAAQDAYAAAVLAREDPEHLARLAAARNRIALAPPARPTRMGDRIAALATRVDLEYGLDLEYGWPRLWLVLPEETRAVLAESRDALNSAATLAAWGILYLPLGVLWWPAAAAGALTVIAAYVRGTAAATGLAELMESAVDLHAAALATALGLDVPGDRMTPEIGRHATRVLRKGA